MKRWIMLLLLAAFAAMAGSTGAAGAGGTARIFSTVGHSEFCPAGNVTLDLATGRYALTPRAARRVCSDDKLERPVLEGSLSEGASAALRTAFRRVLKDGPGDRHCMDTIGPDDDIIISNGGTPILVLTTGAFTLSAPEDLTCWSDAARDLHDALTKTFASHQGR